MQLPLLTQRFCCGLQIRSPPFVATFHNQLQKQTIFLSAFFAAKTIHKVKIETDSRRNVNV